MQAAEIIALAEDFFDREALELQIDYCKTILKAAVRDFKEDSSQADPAGSATPPADEADPATSQSKVDPAGSAEAKATPAPAKSPKPARRARLSLAQTNLCNQNLSLLTEALRLQKLLVQAAVNKALGPESPYANTPLPRHTGDLYADYCDRRLMLKPKPTPRAYNQDPGTPPPIRPRTEVANFFNKLGSEGSATRLRSNEPEGRTAARQERASEPHNPYQRPAGNGRHEPDQATGAALSGPNGQHKPEQANTHPSAQTVEHWAEEANHWLITGDFEKPMPRLSPQAASWLEQQSHHDPEAAKWMRVLEEMNKLDQAIQTAGPGGARHPVQS